MAMTAPSPTGINFIPIFFSFPHRISQEDPSKQFLLNLSVLSCVLKKLNPKADHIRAKSESSLIRQFKRGEEREQVRLTACEFLSCHSRQEPGHAHSSLDSAK